MWWGKKYEIFNGGTHLYDVEEDEVNMELDLWRGRGYTPTVNHTNRTIQIKEM